MASRQAKAISESFTLLSPTAKNKQNGKSLHSHPTEDALHNANQAHWLPAYCAHALNNFSEEHLSILANPDTLASFNTEVLDPLLNSEASKAQEYLQGLLATADDGFILTMSTVKLPNLQRFSQALIFLSHPWVGCACKPSKAMMAATFPATSILPPKQW